MRRNKALIIEKLQQTIFKKNPNNEAGEHRVMQVRNKF